MGPCPASDLGGQKSLTRKYGEGVIAVTVEQIRK